MGRVLPAQGRLCGGVWPGSPPGHPQSTALAQSGYPPSQRLQALPPHQRWRPALQGTSARFHRQQPLDIPSSPCGLIPPKITSLSRDIPSRLLILLLGEQQGLHHALPKPGSEVLRADRAGAAAVPGAGLGAERLSQPPAALLPWDGAGVTPGTPGTVSFQLCEGEGWEGATPSSWIRTSSEVLVPTGSHSFGVCPGSNAEAQRHPTPSPTILNLTCFQK